MVAPVRRVQAYQLPSLAEILLQAVAQAPASVLTAQAEEWVPLFLAYVAAKTGGGSEEAPTEVGEEAEHRPATSGKDTAVSRVSAIGGK